LPLFRREKLHERLAREGGLVEEIAVPQEPGPRWGEAPIHGIQRLREWDAVGTAQAPALAPDRVEFTAISGETLLIDEELGEEDVEPLAQALETVLAPPYRALAVRQYGDVWAVAAKTIELVEIWDLEGEELALTVRDGVRHLEVDGTSVFGSVPAVERVASARFGDYAATATRLDDEIWELRVAPL